MTITFRIQAITHITTGWSLVCHCDHVFLSGLSFDDANEMQLEEWTCPTHGPTCAYLDEEYVGDLTPEFNVSNVHARAILARLGLPVDDSGSITADDLQARLSFLLAGDTGTPDITVAGEAGSILVDCGRRAGYFADAADRFAVLVDAARAHNTHITWA